MIKVNRKTKKPVSTRLASTQARGEQIKQKVDIFVINFYAKLIKPFSVFFRRVFEFAGIKRLLGFIIVSSVLSVAIIPVSLTTIKTAIDTNYSNIYVVDSDIVETKQSVRLPVDIFAISQGFSFFHPGIDLASVKGSPVYPIMEGKVTVVEHGSFGYGNHVVVDHENGYESLYAHLAKIEVKQGENVTFDSILGLTGSTGRSTGPHLHLQIWEYDHWTNPRAFFEGYFGQRLASNK